MSAAIEKAGVYIPPALKDVWVNPDPNAPLRATGVDVAGRKQYLYSKEHHLEAKNNKFTRVNALMLEAETIRETIEADLKVATGKKREATLVAYLSLLTGIRPGSEKDTLAKVKAFGATTLQLRHVKKSERGVRLQFTGKKGVKQNVPVVNDLLVKEILERKEATTAYTTPLFNVSASAVNQYVAGLGSGNYSIKDFRTLRGTTVALEIIGKRKRLPAKATDRKRFLNSALDQVAKVLGNTRSVAKNSYVDPSIIERIVQTSNLRKSA